MPKKILLADDSITIQKVVELTFSDGDYEVIPTNNGAKAIQKLSEVRPDIILSDIIMPEKNGYEVCEYVKSHPEYRNIPVVLLTGTFEPFDPDRAEKAGCDAIVTKPFESQSLIHKVEDLIAQSQSAASSQAASSPTSSEGFAPGASFESPAPQQPAPFESSSSFGEESASPFGASETASTSSRGFGAEKDDFATSAMPPSFGGQEQPPFSGFDTPAAPEEPAAPAWGTTPAFDFNAPPAQSGFGGAENPFDAPPQDESPLDQTFPSARQMEASKSESETAVDHGNEIFGGASSEAKDPYAMPFESQQSSGFGEEAPAPPAGETLAFPKMSFDDLQRLQSGGSAPSEQPADTPFEEQPAGETVPFAPSMPAANPPEEPAFGGTGGETLAFPKMSFADLQRMQEQNESSSENEPWGAPAEPTPAPPAPAEMAWSPKSGTSSELGSDAFAGSSAPLTMGADALPFESGTTAREEMPASSASEASQWSITSKSTEDPPAAERAASSPAAAGAAATGSLTDEQVDRIARRVIELMSDQVVRNIAWEVIPDVASSIVRERIRQLESES